MELWVAFGIVVCAVSLLWVVFSRATGRVQTELKTAKDAHHAALEPFVSDGGFAWDTQVNGWAAICKVEDGLWFRITVIGNVKDTFISYGTVLTIRPETGSFAVDDELRLSMPDRAAPPSALDTLDMPSTFSEKLVDTCVGIGLSAGEILLAARPDGPSVQRYS